MTSSLRRMGGAGRRSSMTALRCLTKKIHSSRSAAADLGHALACGYARGSGAGLAVAGPGSLPAP